MKSFRFIQETLGKKEEGGGGGGGAGRGGRGAKGTRGGGMKVAAAVTHGHLPPCEWPLPLLCGFPSLRTLH